MPIPPAPLRRSSRARKKPVVGPLREGVEVSSAEEATGEGEDAARSGDEAVPQQVHTAYQASTSCDNEPTTFADAMSRADADQWYAAMAEELRTFVKIGLYEEVPRPPDRKIIDSKWVYKVKRGPSGNIDKYKARLVAKGFSQVYGVDYTETFAPVAKFSTIRLLLALAARYNLEIHQMDVKSAFLNGKLEEEVYLRPPPGFRDSSDMVWRLHRALYGLKQAPKSWYTRLREVFTSLGFTRSNADHSLFYKVENEPRGY